MTNTQTTHYRLANVSKTFYATIHIAGDVSVAEQFSREYTFVKGWCVQITPTTYVYTGGKEDGMTIRVICYPRFPRPDDEILQEVSDFAAVLANKLCQMSYTIESSTNTYYYESTDPLHVKK